MIAGKRVLGVVAARGGSKGLPGKNLLPLAGRPIVAWSVAAAAAAGTLDRTVVSTDDPAIAEAARAAGGDVPFLRPAALARDESPIVDAVLHALDALGGSYDAVVLLQAATPLRDASDIDGCVRRWAETGADFAVSVCEAAKPPDWALRLAPDSRAVPYFGGEGLHARRQDNPTAYFPNGAVYVASVPVLRAERRLYGPNLVAYEMPPERSVDIDRQVDYVVARHYAEMAA